MLNKLREILMALKLTNGERLIPDNFYGNINVEFRNGKIYQIVREVKFIPELIA